MSRVKSRPDGYLIAIIGDEDTATGFLLAGVGDKEGTNGSNYFVVDPSTFGASACIRMYPHAPELRATRLLTYVRHPIENTPVPAIEEAFKKFVEREDIAILLINQYVCFASSASAPSAPVGFLLTNDSVSVYAQIADKIRGAISKFNEPMPAILEIPSKEHPYDPNKDYILQRVRGMLGSSS